MINLGDPLLKKISPNVKIKNTDFDGGIGKPIYSDPTKTIFKTIPIDINHDGLKDLIIVYTDGTIKLLKNYGGNDPYKNVQSLMVIADDIKDVLVGDVDNNGYPDIIVKTMNNKVKVYKNKQGIFDVDGSLVCLNTNTAT